MIQEVFEELLILGHKGHGSIIDPSRSEILVETGVAQVTVHIEELSKMGLVKEARPLFGSAGGMWIGYTLSEQGLEMAGDLPNFRELLIQKGTPPENEVSLAVEKLKVESEEKNIPDNLKPDFLNTLHEISVCFRNDCYIASISLSGKVLEICLRDILDQNQVTLERTPTIGYLLTRIRQSVPDQYLDPSIENLAKIISLSRNTSVHYNEQIPIPSRDQAIMVIFAMRDLVNRHFTN